MQVMLGHHDLVGGIRQFSGLSKELPLAEFGKDIPVPNLSPLRLWNGGYAARIDDLTPIR